jgi:hypothetical protein
MQLRYARMARGNFGDDLNVDLWPELFPDFAEEHADAHLYGVGTLLGGSRPDGMKYVLGSGCGSMPAGACTGCAARAPRKPAGSTPGSASATVRCCGRGCAARLRRYPGGSA